MNQKGFSSIVLIIIIVAIVAVGGYFVFSKKSLTPPGRDVSPDVLPGVEPINELSFTVLSPNGGEEWTRGAQLPIRWNKSDNVDIKLIFESCANDLPCSPSQGEIIVQNISGISHDWIVGSVLPGGTEFDSGTIAMDGNYKVKICLTGTQVCDSSDLPFKIVFPATD